MTYFLRLEGGWVYEAGHVMFVGHSCEYTKAGGQPDRPLSVAPIIDLRQLPDGQLELAQADRMSRYWALPMEHPIDWPAAVDLANIQPFVATDLERSHRVTSINDFGQMALAGRLYTFFSQREFGQ